MDPFPAALITFELKMGTIEHKDVYFEMGNVPLGIPLDVTVEVRKAEEI